MSERRIAWTILKRGHDIVTSDGNKVGTVKEVVGDEDQDIFSGVTYSPGLTQPDLFVPADSISEITDQGVVLTLDHAGAAALEPYEG
jgi:sporulation protein YlmC with PRC-barrel domain